MVSNQTFSNGLSNGVNLGNVTTTSDSDSDVNVSKFVQTNNEQWFVNLETQDFWFNKGYWRTIDFDETFTGLDVSNGSSTFFFTKSLEKVSIIEKSKSDGWGYCDSFVFVKEK